MEEGNEQYRRLYLASEHYKLKGFKYIDVPWIIPPHITNITRPEGATPFTLANQTDLVGSSEQSFIYLVSLGQLTHGMYQTITPCFRDDAVDHWHQKYFTKLELFKNDIVNEYELDRMILNAQEFFNRYTTVKSIKTEEGYDLISEAGIELGSYGIREHVLVGKWIYGTGLAEPRLSKVIDAE